MNNTGRTTRLSSKPDVLTPATKTLLKNGGSEHGPEELGALLDSMLRSGVAADGSTSTEKNKEMMARMSQLGPQTPVRCGKRTAASVDADSLEKAMRRTAARNLDDAGKSSFFDAVSSTSIVSNLSSVGLLPGNSEVEIERSVELLRKVDKSRAKLPVKFHDVCVEDDVVLLSPETQLGADFHRGITEGGEDLSDPLFDVPIKMVAPERKPRGGSRVKQIKKKIIFQ